MHNQAQTIGHAVLAAPVDISTVQQKTADFQFKMKELVSALADAPSYLQILRPEKLYTQFFIDRDALGRLNAIAAQDDFVNFGVYFGLEDPDSQEPLADSRAAGFGRLTCSFVGLDKDFKVLATHFSSGGQAAEFSAEETWPPPPPGGEVTNVFDLTNEVTDVFSHFSAAE